jgi:hypothetical protein
MTPDRRQPQGGWQHERVSTVRFRRSPATALAAVVFMIAALSVARWAPYLLILLVIPAVVAMWSWRSGTDADQAGLTVRALLGSRRIPWSDVAGLVHRRPGHGERAS